MFIKSFLKLIKKSLVLLCVISVLQVKAQLGFCSGSLGMPIYKEDFGAGKSDNKLNPKRTTYSFAQGPPKDGYYKVSSNTNWYGWFPTKDHTPNDKNGKCLIVNASNEPGEFFTMPVFGLCENTTYEFSSWLINLFPAHNKVCGFFKNERANPINITFEIWDSNGALLLKKGDTGNIYGSSRPNWKQYGLVFKTKPGQTSVILKMRNNGVGGCGNDLAIDDIMFRTCGDSVIIEDETKGRHHIFVEENTLPFSTILNAVPDLSVFSSHFYQWQKSDDAVNWINLPKATNSSFSVKNVNAVTYYRALIAEAAINLLNSSCHVISEVYKVNVIASKGSKEQFSKVKPPELKKRFKIEKEVIEIDSIRPKKTALDSVPNSKPKLYVIEKKVITKSSKLQIKTKKQVILVKNGLKTIHNKVWIDGVIGRFVKTSEKIIKQGDENAGFIINEIIYYKTIYGYNSNKRTYTTNVKP